MYVKTIKKGYFKDINDGAKLRLSLPLISWFFILWGIFLVLLHDMNEVQRITYHTFVTVSALFWAVYHKH